MCLLKTSLHNDDWKVRNVFLHISLALNNSVSSLYARWHNSKWLTRSGKISNLGELGTVKLQVSNFALPVSFTSTPKMKSFQAAGEWEVISWNLQSWLTHWPLGERALIFKHILLIDVLNIQADSRFATRQWETALLCNDVSHWLDANLESALIFNVKLAPGEWYRTLGYGPVNGLVLPGSHLCLSQWWPIFRAFIKEIRK